MAVIEESHTSKSVSDQFLSKIEELVAEADYRDALDHLQDYATDFCPQAKREVLLLRSRYNRWRSAQRQGITSTENINDISSAILEAGEAIYANWTVPQQYEINDQFEPQTAGSTEAIDGFPVDDSSEAATLEKA